MNPHWVETNKWSHEPIPIASKNYFSPPTNECDVNINILMTQNPTSLLPIYLIGFCFGKEKIVYDMGNMDPFDLIG
jgi:hypothetical protein